MNKALFWIAVLAVIVVAVVAGIVSYDHLYTVAIAAGEEDWISRLVPLSADGLLISASLSAFVAKWQNRKVHGMTKLSLVVGLSASIAANIASPFVGDLTSGHQAVLAAIVGAWPAIALALSFEEILRLSAMWKQATEGTSSPVAISTEVTEVVESAEALPEAVNVTEMPEQAEVPEVPVSVEVAAPRPRKSASGSTSVKAEALDYMATNPNTSAADLAVRFDRSERWARMIRKESQQSRKALQLVSA